MLTTITKKNVKPIESSKFSNRTASETQKHKKKVCTENRNIQDLTTRDHNGLIGAYGRTDPPCTISGFKQLFSKQYNKGLAFTLKERQRLGIHGIMPPVVETERAQIERCILWLARLKCDLQRYLYLMSLHEHNQRLFYKLFSAKLVKMMSYIYMPTMGLATLQYSGLYHFPQGMFITIKDKGHVYEVLKNWPEVDVRIICVTDGGRILSYGDLGANGMNVPLALTMLYTALGAIQPYWCLPIFLDVGTNNDSLIEDPLYIGLRQKRVEGTQYHNFLAEFMGAVVRRFGQHCLVHFKGFGSDNSFHLMNRHRQQYCCFNDDIQGIAAVALAGLYASLRVVKRELHENTILFLGAGEAAIGIADFCIMAMKEKGLTEAEAAKRIWMVDRKGLIVQHRPTGGINEFKARFARDHSQITSFVDVVRTCKPTVLIGVSTIGGAFTPEILKLMAEYNKTPIIFALSNPIDKAECTAEQAYTHTKGTCLFSCGTQLPPFTCYGKTFHPSQGNNFYGFPGIGLAVSCCGMSSIPDGVFLVAARTIASLVTEEELDRGSLYPALERMQSCALEIAAAIIKYAYRKNIALKLPKPKNIKEYIRKQMYELDYPEIHPKVYSY